MSRDVRDEIKDLPMDDTHKDMLKKHWGNLQNEFKISTMQ